MNKRILTISILILVAALSRLIQHPYNFSPVGAIALFGGAYLNRKHLAYIIPIIALLISDAFLGFYGMGMIVTYLAFAGSVFIGTLLSRNLKWYTVGAASVAGSVLFFLITNFALIYPETLYTHDLNGIFTSYAMGVPFFSNTLVSDLFFSTMLFGSYYLLSINIPALQQEAKA